MLKLRVGLLVALVAMAGCTPGTYNVNVGVTPQGLPVGVATPAPSASPAPVTSPSTSPTPTPTPTPAYDTNQEKASTFREVGNGSRLAQSFKIKRDGKLASIGVRMKGVGDEAVPTLTVCSLKGDLPNDAKPLASGQIGPQNLEGAWGTAIFEPPLPVKAGETYAFVLSMNSPFSVYAGADLDTTYLDGTAFGGLADGSTFWNKLTQDLAFRTIVQ